MNERLRDAKKKLDELQRQRKQIEKEMDDIVKSNGHLKPWYELRDKLNQTIVKIDNALKWLQPAESNVETYSIPRRNV